ncbi:MAG: ABC transporter substrate-binding protein [Planctomycetota bacterium]|nr:ABC transporter substrate-binding protein [Planctomycetota bacterium]
MRERHIFWDVAPLVLLGFIAVLMSVEMYDRHRAWQATQKILKTQTELAEQNRTILNKLAEGVKFSGSTGAGNGHASNGLGTAERGDLPVDVALPKVPDFEYGDEQADDGDWLVVTLGSEPNSLNSLIDNDATASDLFSRAHDPLAARNFYDLSAWEPRLARAWKKELVCVLYPKDGDAKRLAQDLEGKWDAGLREKLQIRRIAAEAGEGGAVVQIEIGDVNNEYREHLKRDFGERILPQWWFYVEYRGNEFPDGSKITPATLGEYVLTRLKKNPDFTGKVLPVMGTEDTILMRVLGDEKARDACAAGLKALRESPENKSLVIDPKSVSGKREEVLLTSEVMEDYLAQEKPIFTFYLRKDARWQDGQPVTGKDIVFTFQTMMDPQIECGPQRNYYRDCESIALVGGDPYVVRFTWMKPYFDAWSTSANFEPMAEHYYRYNDPKEFNTGKQNQNLMGNGMYRLERWDRGQQFVFTRNEDYYGRKPHLLKIVYKVVKDPTVELQLFESGQTDVNGLTPPQMKAKENDPEFRKKFDVNISVANSYRYVGWNARKPMFADKRVRQALTMLVDRQRICDTIYRGYAIPIHGPVHPENPAYWKETPNHVWPFDPERARKQLDEAGWMDSDGDGIRDKDGVPFKFTLLFPANSNEFDAMGNQIKSEFGKAGIEVTLSNLEWAAFLQKIERLQFDACILGWRLGAGEEDPYQLWHSSQTDEKESNFCNFVNTEADRIIEECRRELDSRKRYERLHRFQQLIMEEQPYTFLFVSKRLVAFDKRIHNIQYRLVGSNQSRWFVPKELQKY